MERNNDQVIEIDLMEVLKLIKSHLVLIIVVTIAFGGLGFLGTKLFITPQYEASVNMIVNTRTDSSTAVSNDNINSAQNLVSTYAIIITGNTVLDQVIDDLNLDLDYDELADKVTVADIDDTQVMKISVTDPDPELAKKIVKDIAALSPDEIVDAVEAGSCKVISKVTVTDEPVSPSNLKNTAIAAMIGLVLVIGIIVIKNLFGNEIVDDEDVQKYLNLPILGVIPEIEEAAK